MSQQRLAKWKRRRTSWSTTTKNGARSLSRRIIAFTVPNIVSPVLVLYSRLQAKWFKAINHQRRRRKWVSIVVWCPTTLTLVQRRPLSYYARTRAIHTPYPAYRRFPLWWYYIVDSRRSDLRQSTTRGGDKNGWQAIVEPTLVSRSATPLMIYTPLQPIHRASGKKGRWTSSADETSGQQARLLVK